MTEALFCIYCHSLQGHQHEGFCLTSMEGAREEYVGLGVMTERQWPVRARNHATGYAYTKHDHCQKWRLPDGTEVMTGWIEPGDTETLSKSIRTIWDQVERLQARHELLCEIYQTVSKEDKQ